MKKINLKIIFTLVILIFSFKGYSQKNKNKEYPMPLISLKSGSLVSYVKILKLDSNSVKILTLNLDTTSYYFNEIKNIDAVKTGYLNYVLQRETDSIQNIEKIKVTENRKRGKKEEFSSQLNSHNSYNYFYLGGGFTSLNIKNEGIENIIQASKTLEAFSTKQVPFFTGYNLNMEYLINFYKGKNIGFMLDINQVKSTIDAPYAKLDFINNSATIYLGYYFYQKFIKASFGSGISLTQNEIITSIEGRPDILCGKMNYFTVPFYMQFRYSSRYNVSFSLRPNLNLNLINSNLIPSYSLNAGISFYIFNKNKN